MKEFLERYGVNEEMMCKVFGWDFLYELLMKFLSGFLKVEDLGGEGQK